MKEYNDRYLYNISTNCIDEVSKVKSILLYKYCKYSSAVISVCIPTFNRISDVKKAIQSVFNQIVDPSFFELIIIDNDSNTDGESIRSFLEMTDFCNIFYYKNSINLGQLGNWNKCIELANTDWICMLHDDDEMYNDCIQTMLYFLSKKSDKLAYIKTNFDRVDNGVLVKKNKFKSFLEKALSKKLVKIKYKDILINGNAGLIGAPTCGTLMSKKAIYAVGGFSDKWGKASDAYIPFLLLKEYDVFSTNKSMGIINYGNNESCKDATIRDWLKDYILFQNYLSSLNRRYYKFNKKFGRAQIVSFIQWCLSIQNKDISEYDNYFIIQDVYPIKKEDLENKNLKKLRRIKKRHNAFRMIMSFFNK